MSRGDIIKNCHPYIMTIITLLLFLVCSRKGLNHFLTTNKTYTFTYVLMLRTHTVWFTCENVRH